ncbi:MAG: hypothetical protein ACOX2B_01855 [Syntrophothermaceae bacterium]
MIFGMGGRLRFLPLPCGWENLLASSLYEHLASLIMVSATLTVAEDFAYFIERNGLEAYRGEKLATITRQSPFDYDRNCRMYVVNDLANPGHGDYERQCGDFLQEFLAQVPGRTLVLFTSTANAAGYGCRAASTSGGTGYKAVGSAPGWRVQHSDRRIGDVRRGQC